jgi:hypothetical protein
MATHVASQDPPDGLQQLGRAAQICAAHELQLDLSAAPR